MVAVVQKNVKEADIVAEVRRLDKSEDYVGVFYYLKQTPFEISDALFCLAGLMADGRLQTAFIVAKLLVGTGIDNPVVDLARTIGGIAFGNAAEEEQGSERLVGSIGRLNPMQLAQVREQIAEPALRHAEAHPNVARDADSRARLDRIRRIVIPGAEIKGETGVARSAGPMAEASKRSVAGAETRPAAASAFSPQADHAEMLRAVQMACSNDPVSLDFIAGQIIGSVKSATNGALYPLTEPAVLKRLAETGYGVRKNALTKKKVAEVTTRLASVPLYAAHSAGYARRGPGTLRDFKDEPQASYRYRDILTLPHLLELAVSPTVLGVVSNYLGCLPMICEMNLLWSNPTGKRATYGQTFHRDLNDFRWVTMFVYLTDVDENSGPHCYIPGTHRTDLFAAMLQKRIADPKVRAAAQAAGVDMGRLLSSAYDHGYGKLDPFYQAAFGDSLETICGPAGTAILEDTRGLHFGKPPVDRPRLSMWVVYGLYKNNCFAHSTMEQTEFRSVANRLPNDNMTRYVTQLMFTG